MNQAEFDTLDRAAHILAREGEMGRYWPEANDFERVSDEVERMMERARPFVEPNPSTREVREELLYTLRRLSRHWAGLTEQTAQERCDGLVHSVLCIFDGVTDGLPALDIVVDGIVINENTMLHELWARINA